MATAALKIGKFEVAQQNGQAGSQIVGVKYIEQHTGRGKYMKQLRANAGTESAIATYEVEGKPVFLTLDTDMTEITYNTVQTIINGVSNAEKFRVSTVDGKEILLKANTGYTVNQNEGVFSEGFGVLSQGTFAILVEFAINSTSTIVEYPVSIEIWDGLAWVNAGTFRIKQSSSDASVNFVITPNTLPQITKTGETKVISVESNIDFNITKQGGSDTSWVTLDKSSGKTGATEINITIAAQNIGSAKRNLTLVFKNMVSNSVIGQLTITQAAGDAYSVSWEHDTVSFENSELNIIKNNNLTANADWYLEEVV